MAKRYARLNWQNTPSVATPMNATNLNKMDKGIDDCDNAIEEIYNKRVNNVVTTNKDTFLAGPVGKYLQDQISELNKNMIARTLSNIKTGIFRLTDAASFGGALDEPLANLFGLNYSDAVYPIDVVLINSYGNFENGGSVFQGGKYRMVGEVAATASGVHYGSVIIYGYFIPRTRCANNGAWSNWADIA